MFSINILIKLFVSSSTSIMWSLIHVLQIFRFMLMININMPYLMSLIIEYLAVVIGEIEEIDELVPDVYNMYVIDSDELNQNAVILERFEDNGYSEPYLTDMFGRQALLLTVNIIFWIPFLYLLMYLSKNISKLSVKLVRVWSELFWNVPVRAFTELYIEISLGCFLHSLNVSICS